MVENEQPFALPIIVEIYIDWRASDFVAAVYLVFQDGDFTEGSRWSCATKLGGDGAECAISFDMGSVHDLAAFRLGKTRTVPSKYSMYGQEWPRNPECFAPCVVFALFFCRHVIALGHRYRVCR